MNRKDFISTFPSIIFVPEIANRMSVYNIENPKKGQESVKDEINWKNVQDQFFLDENFVDLRAFASSSIPKTTLENFIHEYRSIQAFPSTRNHGIVKEGDSLLRRKISENLNCSFEEVAIMRSTTEALNNALMGIKLKAGDEVLASVHEYDSMIATLVQRQKREGIVVTNVEVPYQPTSKEQILECFKRSVTIRTKIILISHIVWISGQIYPIQEICEWARKKNIITVIDAAQSFSHIEVDVSKIDCDYLGASLHKWCAAPLGTGFLYIKRDNIASTFPLFASYEYSADSPKIEKFENFGSSTPIFDSCVKSLDYWTNLGLDEKRNRIQFLKNYLADKLKDLKDIEIVTNLDPDHSCGILYFKVKNNSASELKERLYKKYNISVQAIENYKNLYVDYKGVNCIGVSTPVFILERQLDYFVDSLKNLIS